MDEDDFETDSLAALFGALPKPRNRRFRPIDVAVLSLLTVHNLADAVTSSLAAAYNAVASHANHLRDVEDMAEQAAREIETMTGDDNG